RRRHTRFSRDWSSDVCSSDLREALLEAVAEVDDELMAKYLEGEEITPEEIRRALRKGCLNLQLVPVLCGSAFKNKGIQPLLDAKIGRASCRVRVEKSTVPLVA